MKEVLNSAIYKVSLQNRVSHGHLLINQCANSWGLIYLFYQFDRLICFFFPLNLICNLRIELYQKPKVVQAVQELMTAQNSC